MFPLVFASNIMVNPATMPGWLGTIVAVNPVTHMATAMRGLMGGSATLHEVWLALAAPLALTAALGPLTIWLYRRR
jgi:ABC-2 type transport system permease protein